MTETAESNTVTSSTIRINGQDAIDYAAAGHDTRLICSGHEGMGVFVPTIDDVDPEKAQEMVDNGTSPDLFYCDADPRVVALGKLTGDFDFSEARYGDNRYESGRVTYLVLTDDEADEAAAEAIKNSLWAFNASFISGHTKKGLSDAAQKALQEAQAKLCEGANDLVESMIDDLDDFIEDAIRADGRGHFLSSYNGEENEESVGGTTYYIYREN